jgi:hypothetical protein
LKALEFEYPLQLLEEFHKIITDKLNSALTVRDHYSIYYLIAGGRKISLKQYYFIPRLEEAENRQKKIQERMKEVLSLNYDETKINEELDELI